MAGRMPFPNGNMSPKRRLAAVIFARIPQLPIVRDANCNLVVTLICGNP